MRVSCPRLTLVLFAVSLSPVLLPTLPVLAQTAGVDRQLIGKWLAEMPSSPVRMQFWIEQSGKCGVEDEAGICQAAAGVLVFRSASTGQSRYSYKLQGGLLTLSGGDLAEPLVFRRIEPAGSAGGRTATTPTGPFAAAREKMGGAQPAPAPARPDGPLSEADLVRLLDAGLGPGIMLQLVKARGVSFAVTPESALKLKKKGATEELLAALRQQSANVAPAAPSTSSAPPAPVAAAPTKSRPQEESADAGLKPDAASRGQRYRHEEWGVSFAVPPAWKVADRKVALLLGSDTEAGLMVVRFVRQTSAEALLRDYAEGLEEGGVRLAPAAKAESFSAGQSRGLAGELAGTGTDGARLRARIIAVLTPFGDAAVLMGLTTQEKYPQLKPRVESLAASFSFARPKAPAANQTIAGQYAYYYSSTVGSYSRQDLLNLCSNGVFSRGGELYTSNTAGSLASQSGNSGRWSAEGDENQGMITLLYQNGRSNQIQYRRAGADMIFDGKKYGRYGDGSCRQRSPF